MEKGQFLWIEPPYLDWAVGTEASASTGSGGVAGSCLVWRIGSDDLPAKAELARSRPRGVPLVVVLPPSTDVVASDLLLDVVERCRPQSILPHHPRPDPEEITSVLRRPPDDLGAEVTDYLRWRGMAMDIDMRRTVRRVIELSGELRTVSAVARSLYVSRRALGRRFLSQGLPVPSHWLQIGRLLRATIQLQNGSDNLFSVACALGYPDGFSLSNQMKRLTGVRPSTAREALGWEWLFEAWLAREQSAGGLGAPAVAGASH